MSISTISVFAQQEKMEFVQKKIASDGYTVYFQVDGISGEEQAQNILEDLLNDSNIKGGRYFKSGDGKDRYQLYINDMITAAYIRDILLANNVDYDYSTIIVNGINPESNNSALKSGGSSKTSVSALGFPSYEHTGNPQLDDSNYNKSKEEWIKENPEEYESMLKELEKNNKID